MGMTTHYVVQSGLRDMPAEERRVFTSREFGVQWASERWDLNPNQERALRDNGYVYLDLLLDGADYVECWQCTCPQESTHYMPEERRVTA